MRRLLVLSAVVAGALALAGCSSSGTGSSAAGTGSPGTPPSGPPCPVAPVPVVVSVDQWGSIARALGGACAEVTTIVSGTAGDPHEYEPTPGDQAAFGKARLVVLNGLGYDAWATKAVDALGARPLVLDAGAVAGRADGGNPHVWYDPGAVEQVALQLSADLKELAPEAAAYFEARSREWATAKQRFDAAVGAVRSAASGSTGSPGSGATGTTNGPTAGAKRYLATEPVFADLAKAVGLVDVTPSGFAAAVANDGEPAPGDLHEAQQVLRDHGADVLIVNTQTEGSGPSQLRAVAEEAGIPVVEVTETIPPGQPGFLDWQIDQLQRLAQALGAG